MGALLGAPGKLAKGGGRNCDEAFADASYSVPLSATVRLFVVFLQQPKATWCDSSATRDVPKRSAAYRHIARRCRTRTQASRISRFQPIFPTSGSLSPLAKLPQQREGRRNREQAIAISQIIRKSAIKC